MKRIMIISLLAPLLVSAQQPISLPVVNGQIVISDTVAIDNPETAYNSILRYFAADGARFSITVQDQYNGLISAVLSYPLKRAAVETWIDASVSVSVSESSVIVTTSNVYFSYTNVLNPEFKGRETLQDVYARHLKRPNRKTSSDQVQAIVDEQAAIVRVLE